MHMVSIDQTLQMQIKLAQTNEMLPFVVLAYRLKVRLRGSEIV